MGQEVDSFHFHFHFLLLAMAGIPMFLHVLRVCYSCGVLSENVQFVFTFVVEE